MPRFSANISMLFTELPFLDRFAAAKRAGFDAVECWFPYDHPAETLRRVLSDNGLAMVGINTAPGAPGEWGLAAMPGREQEFDRQIKQAIAYAATFGCGVHVLAGLTGGLSPRAAEAAYLRNLTHALRLADGSGIKLLLEPLNSRDRPTYFLHSVDHTAALIAREGLTALKLMFDCYHVQIESGDVLGHLRRQFPIIGHIQIASAPDRAEPDHGEIDYPQVFAEVDRLAWDGWVGAEYQPRTTTEHGLGWLAKAS